MTETPEKPVELETREEFEAFLDEHDRALVDFYTKGCTLCQSIEPVVGNVARATDVAVGKCNPQHALDLVEDYNIRSVPTLILFEDGEEVGRLAEGFQGTERVVEFVESGGETETAEA
ncbi:thioredoxin family protein [Halospeciosus flavus]|uniref:Thioredoxin family protein n=1 Tax=Halospeciosus flavus TaxID=3032283 RepID=A0ABD5Z5K7_9EURY|nr:thioredoxin family protein [Halospeciosus flavus]